MMFIFVFNVLIYGSKRFLFFLREKRALASSLAVYDRTFLITGCRCSCPVTLILPVSSDLESTDTAGSIFIVLTTRHWNRQVPLHTSSDMLQTPD